MSTTPNTPFEQPVAYCRNCGRGLTEAQKREVMGVIYCEPCLAARMAGTPVAGAPVAPGVVAAAQSGPNPVAAALLGFIPGVGAFYNGQYVKGIVHVLIFASLVSIVDATDSPFFGILIAAFVLYMPWEAYRTAKSFQTGVPAPDPLGINSMFGEQNFRKGLTNPAAAPGQAKPGIPVGAVVLILLGFIFLLGSLGVGSFVNKFWPVLMIGGGIYLIAKRISGSTTSGDHNPVAYWTNNPVCGCMRCVSQTMTGPVLLTTFGVLFLLTQLHVTGFGRLFPIVIIVLGLVKIVQANGSTAGHVVPGVIPASQIPPVPPAPPADAGSGEGTAYTSVEGR